MGRAIEHVVERLGCCQAIGRWCHTQKEARLLEEAGLLLVIRFLPLALALIDWQEALIKLQHYAVE